MLICCLTGIFPVSAAEKKLFPNNYKIILCENSPTAIANGDMTTLSVSPRLEEDSLMLPARYMFENLGYEVSWNNGKTEIKGDKTIEIAQNSKTVAIDGEDVELKNEAQNIDGVLMVSEDLFEHLGYDYKKNKDGLFVIYEGSYVSDYDNNLLMLQGIFLSASASSFGKATPKNQVSSVPLAIELAKSRINLYGRYYPVNVYVKGGIYKIDDTLTFDSAVFNSDIKGVNFKGYDGEAVFTGATELDETLLKPVTDPFTLARIPKNGRGKVAYLDLNEVGLADKFNVSQSSRPYIFVNDVMQIESRWPNSGYANMGNVPTAGYFTVLEDNVRNWTTQTEAIVSGFFRNDYEMLNTKVGSVNGETKTVGLNGISFNVGKTNARYFIRNLLEEVDLPGEWFVDRNTGILYFYPPYSLKDAKLEIATLMDKNMVDISKCQHISFDKITFEKGGGGAIYMPDASDISITNCKFQFFQGYETINNNPGYYDVNPGDNLILDGNEAWMLGKRFINLRTGDINTLKNGNSKITNNRVMGSGFVNSYESVINTGTNWPDRTASCGWLIANNIIQDSEMTTAINPAGIDILTTKNECVNIGQSINDGGVIYVGRAATLWDTEISYNYIHHLNKDHSYTALYNDDGYSGAYWHHNISYEAGQLWIVGAGINMRCENNLAINNAHGYGIGSRMTWNNEHYFQDGILHNEVKDVLANYPIYSTRFPEMAVAVKRNPFFAPWNSTVYGNVGINEKAESAAYGTEAVIAEINKYGAKTMTDSYGNTINVEGKHATKEGNPGYSYSDEYFEDAKTQNWNIKEDSEIGKNHPELLKIDMEEIGLSKGYEHLLNTSKDFKLKAPYNGETGIQPKEITFSWDPVKGASKYRLVVATDPALQNVVYDQTQVSCLHNNSCTVTTLDLNTVYYWKVYAIGLARQDQFEVGNLGGPYSFKTAMKNEVNRENLKLAIDSLKSVLKEIEEGGYEYEEEFFTRANTLLEKAEKIHTNSVDQDERDAVEEEIYNLINISPYYMIVEFKTPSFFNNPNAEWTIPNGGHVTYNGTEITLSSDSPERLNFYVDTDTENNVVCMQVKQKMEGLTAGDYTGYVFKVNKENRNSYQLFVFKEWITEFQKAGMCVELPNFNANKDDEWQNVELASIKCPGGVMTYAAVNGAVLWAGLDRTNTKVEKGGEFGVWRNRYETKMKPAEKIPEKTSLIKRIYQNMENPECIEHFQAILSGMGTLIEMDNSLYNSLDKEKFAKTLYPHIEGGQVKINGTDISDYKETVWKYAILEGYNQSKYDFVLKNKVNHIYNDYVQIEKLDENGRCFKKIMDDSFLDNYVAKVHEEAMGGECKSFEELRQRYARAIFKIAINGCSAGIYGGNTSYMSELITKVNADYMGINIDPYFELDDTGKDQVHAYIGRNGISSDRTLEEIVEEINTKAKSLK